MGDLGDKMQKGWDLWNSQEEAVYFILSKNVLENSHLELKWSWRGTLLTKSLMIRGAFSKAIKCSALGWAPWLR